MSGQVKHNNKIRACAGTQWKQRRSCMNREFLNTYLTTLELERAVCSLNFVGAMQRAHVARFSFNSIGVLLGETLSLEGEALFDKIVRRGRGGYCFEHNKLFFEMLRALGLEVRLALARVLLNRDIEAPLTHRVTILTYENIEYLVDVGFGPLAPVGPLRLDYEGDIVQNGFTYRIVKNDGGDFVLEKLMDGAFFTLYAFNLTRYTDVDCALGHFYSHSHPNAVFVNNLVVSLIRNDAVHSLRNTGYRKFNANGFVDTEIGNASGLRNILADVFNMDFTPAECDRLFAIGLRAKIVE